MEALCTSQNWAQPHKHLIPEIPHMDREPLQSLSGFCPLQTFYTCHFINYLFKTMENGFIHISHKGREFIPNSSHLDQAEQNLLWITPRTKQSYIKKVKEKQTKTESWTTKSNSTCALCSQQFQILPLSSLLKVYINTRAHPSHMTESQRCVNRDVHVCY